MEFWTVFLIATGLAMDCFAVSLGIGTTGNSIKPRRVARLAFHFGLFQGGMTLLGWALGSTVVAYIASVDHWIAFALLGYVGGKMIHESFKHEEALKTRGDPSRGSSLVLLSVATSIDALAVGLSMAMLAVDIFPASLLIAFVSLALSVVGGLTGSFLGVRFGKRMELLGGIILIGIGLRVLISHLMA